GSSPRGGPAGHPPRHAGPSRAVDAAPDGRVVVRAPARCPWVDRAAAGNISWVSRTATRSRARAQARRAKTWADHVQERLPKPIREIVVRAREDDVLLFAAGLGFYALVSAIPLIPMVLRGASLVLADDR